MLLAVSSVDAASILHADLDAFYASVEQLLDPSLRGHPLAVGDGVVLAASYEARAFGVHSGMSGWKANRLCPGLRFVGGHFDDYQRLGDRLMVIFEDFTPCVERISIDEAFLDVAGAVHLFGSPSDIALAVRSRVRDEIGLAVSVGVARTKHLAKIASQVAKPDGLVVVDPGQERAFLAPLPIELMWGVGPSTRARLASVGVRTIGDLAGTRREPLEDLLGRAAGAKLRSLAMDVDPRPVGTDRRSSSVGAQCALGSRDVDAGLVRRTLLYLADRVGSRLRAAGRAGRTVTVRVRFADLHAVTRSMTSRSGVSGTLAISDVAVDLVNAALADHPSERKITLLALSMSNLVNEAAPQLELPLGLPCDPRRPGTAPGVARWGLDHSVDSIRERFGRDSIGYAEVVLSDHERVPEAFRELAERALQDGRDTEAT